MGPYGWGQLGERRGRGSTAFRAALAGLLLGVAVPAAASGPVFGVRAGTAGIGPELAFSLGGRAAVRVGAYAVDYGSSYSETGIDYDADLALRNGLLLFDWHPGGGGFRVTAGAAVNDNRLVVSGPIEELLRREAPDLPPIDFDLGTLRGTAKGSTLGPYLGVGFGNPFGRGPWKLSFDLGVIYHGPPSVRLVADTPLPIHLLPGGREELERLLAEEERALERELGDYRYLPVLSVGLGYSIR